MRQDIAYKYIKIFGKIFGGILLLGLILIPILNYRKNSIFKNSEIKIGYMTPMGKISKIDSTSMSYASNFSLGERVCLQATTENNEGILITIYKNKRIEYKNDCNE